MERHAVDLMQRMFAAAVAAADPAETLAKHLPEKPKGRCVVVGAGKASGAMVLALEAAWPDVDLSGVVAVPYGQKVATQYVSVVEAAHPKPDRASLNAGRAVLEAARGAGDGDLVLALISGGGSSLLAAPKFPFTLEDKTRVNAALLRSGLPISEMNKIRRRLSDIKGGGLAQAAYPAKVVTILISDVPGDNPADIASGPTIQDPTATDDLTYLLPHLNNRLPQVLEELLKPQKATAATISSDIRIIGSPMTSLLAAREIAVSEGLTPIILGDSLEGEAKELGVAMAGITKSVSDHGHPVRAPAVLLSGGETTVSFSSGKAGRGGRNTEFLLAFALAMTGRSDVFALAADTDGIDGTETTAGAWITPLEISSLTDGDADAANYLARHDSYSFFKVAGTLFETGPTSTNVNDFRVVVIP